MTVNATRVRDALDTKYNRHKTNQWVVVEEARAGAGFDGNVGQCDYITLNSWRKGGFQIVGHEIKVSKSDWRRELERPDKAERFKRFCHRWWLACPSDLAREIEHEVPLSWGILAVTEKTIRTLRPAPLNEDREELPVSWWIGWMAQLSRRIDGEFERQISARVRDELDSIKRVHEQNIERARQRWDEQHHEDAQKTAALKDAGIDIARLTKWDIQRFTKAMTLVDALDHRDAADILHRAQQTLALLTDHITEVQT